MDEVVNFLGQLKEEAEGDVEKVREEAGEGAAYSGVDIQDDKQDLPKSTAEKEQIAAEDPSTISQNDNSVKES